MSNIVKVEFNEIQACIKKIDSLLGALIVETDNLKKITNDTEAWNTKYQKVFDNHLNTETVRFIESVIDNCHKYNRYLDKTLQGYRKIDVYR